MSFGKLLLSAERFLALFFAIREVSIIIGSPNYGGDHKKWGIRTGMVKLVGCLLLSVLNFVVVVHSDRGMENVSMV